MKRTDIVKGGQYVARVPKWGGTGVIVLRARRDGQYLVKTVWGHELLFPRSFIRRVK